MEASTKFQMVRTGDTGGLSGLPDLFTEFYWDAFLLIIAVVAWMACRGFSLPKVRSSAAPASVASSASRAEQSKEEVSSNPAELAQLLLQASDRQRGRALDLYCRSRCHINWTSVTEEDKRRVFFNLCLAASRLGRNDMLNGLLRDMEMLQIPRTLDLYTALLKMMTSKRLFRDALQLWKRMRQERLRVTDRAVWSCLLFAATEDGMMDPALFFYQELLKTGGLTDKDYSNVVRLRISRHECHEAFALLEEMCSAGLCPDNVMYNTVFAACCAGGKHLDLAERLFRGQMKECGGCVDAVSYNTFMKGFVQAKRLDNAFALLEEMEAGDLAPTQITFGTLLDACVNEGAMDRAHKLLHRMTRAGCEMNTVLYTTLIKGFVKSKDVEKALGVYGEMVRQGIKPDTRTFSLVLKALCDAGRMEQALEVFETMCAENIEHDEIIFNNLLSGCVVRKNLALGEKLLQDMLKVNVAPSCATFSTLMKLYTECDAVPHAQALLSNMNERFGAVPEKRLYTQLIQSCLRLRQRQASSDAFQALVRQHGPPAESEFAKTLHSCITFNLFEVAVDLSGIMLSSGGRMGSEQLQSVVDAAAKKRKVAAMDAAVELARKHRLSVRLPA